MVVLILAAGNQTRWGRFTPKHLMDVGGKAVIVRILHQVRERTGQPPVIVTCDHRLMMWGEFFEPEMHRCTMETLLHTRTLWEDRTVILLGDVIFSSDAIDKILTCRDSMRVFGRRDLAHRVVGCYYEIFALSFDQTAQRKVAQTLRIAESLPNFLTWGKLRTFYELYCGLPLGQSQHENTVFYPIEDWTDDIDSPEDYERFQRMIIQKGLLT